MANKKRELPEIEVKDRTYVLVTESTPLSYQLRSKHTRFNPLLWFDGNIQRAMRYCSNQLSFFEDRQDDNALLEPIVFEDGVLHVRAEKNLLQQFLAAHPDYGVVFKELDPEQESEEQLESEYKALDAAISVREADIHDLEAIARVLWKGKVDKMMSSEIRNDLFKWAKANPEKYMSLANNSDIRLRNLGVRAVDMGVLKVVDDGRAVAWVDNGEKLISVPFGENVYSALASYFKTDEGMDAMEKIMVELS